MTTDNVKRVESETLLEKVKQAESLLEEVAVRLSQESEHRKDLVQITLSDTQDILIITNRIKGRVC